MAAKLSKLFDKRSKVRNDILVLRNGRSRRTDFVDSGVKCEKQEFLDLKSMVNYEAFDTGSELNNQS